MEKIYLKLIDSQKFMRFISFINKDISERRELNEKQKEELIVNIKICENDLVEYEYNSTQGLLHLVAYFINTILGKLISKEKNKKVKDLLTEEVSDNDYIESLTLFELERYLKTNDTIIEKSFIMFNLKGLEEDIISIKEQIISEVEYDDFLNKIYKGYEEKGILVSDYETVEIKYIDGVLNIINQKQEALNIDNIEAKLGLSINKDEDDWIIDLSVCTIVCSLLKVKKLLIPSEYEELYNELITNDSLVKKGIEIILI